jgi:hypothetical protein
MAVPYTFGSATTSIPLSQLDSNFATAITLGNTAVQLGNTITTLTGVTNVASSGSLTLGTSGNTTAITIDTAQNVGIAVTPSAWQTSSYKVLQGKSGTLRWQDTSLLSLDQNVYVDSGYSAKYVNTGYASQYIQYNGAHQWLAAPSGTAGNAATLTQILAVEKDKSLALQGATSQSGTGIAFPATQIASSDANTLDDYEEGAWTPNQGSGLTVVGTFNSNGTYTKVGRMVYVRGVVAGSTSVSCASGTPITSNLPFSTYGDNPGAAFNASLLNGTILDFTGTVVYTTGVMTATSNIYFSATYAV